MEKEAIKRNIESGLSIQKGFESVHCSKTDLPKIFEYFNCKNSSIYKDCLKVINKALQKNLQSVTINSNNVGYLKAVKANCFKFKSQSGSKFDRTSF